MNEGLRQFFITNWAALLSIAPIDDLFDCLLTRALAVELAPICVNAMSPGVVRTNLWQNMGAAERENLYESVGKSLSVGRVGEAYDIAQAYLS
jgi:NAD(P)-dependent dehydrogenase (short-subunit alcohol dehydrogenase family)